MVSGAGGFVRRGVIDNRNIFVFNSIFSMGKYAMAIFQRSDFSELFLCSDYLLVFPERSTGMRGRMQKMLKKWKKSKAMSAKEKLRVDVRKYTKLRRVESRGLQGSSMKKKLIRIFRISQWKILYGYQRIVFGVTLPHGV